MGVPFCSLCKHVIPQDLGGVGWESDPDSFEGDHFSQCEIRACSILPSRSNWPPVGQSKATRHVARATRAQCGAAKKMLEAMRHDELREARQLTQEQLARVLRVDQTALTKMGRRTDMSQHASRDHQGYGRATGNSRHFSGWGLCASISFRICGSARRSAVTVQQSRTKIKLT
jgi:hypothetical protein